MMENEIIKSTKQYPTGSGWIETYEPVKPEDNEQFQKELEGRFEFEVRR